MKFLLDVNASGSLTGWLLERGHDVLQVRKVDARMKDDAVLQWAVSEERIIITTDQDFEEMIWRENRQHKGVLRMENLPRVERLALLEYVLTHHSDDLAAGAIVIASSRKIRVRKP
jgi:predicted nuclease of predicted toxin-antitoxin system